MPVYKAECKCGKFDFVFEKKPKNKVEVICPNCGEKSQFDPVDLVEVKEKGKEKGSDK